MSRILIACSMLENELKSIIPNDMQVIWIDRGLHEWPDKLRAKLQETLDTLPIEVDTVLLAFGFCGNALNGIKCNSATLVLPLFDDCIGMLLCGKRDHTTMYFTEGWLQDELFLGNAYLRDVEKYGSKKARRIYDVMLASYKSLTILCTNAFDVEAAKRAIVPVSAQLNLPILEAKGHVSVLSSLINDDDGDCFWHLPPGKAFSLLEFLKRKGGSLE